MTKLLVLGSLVGAVLASGAYVRKRRIRRAMGEPQPSADDDFTMIPDADVVEEVVIIGLSDVDPEGVREQRDQLRK